MDKDINIRANTIKLLKENIGGKLMILDLAMTSCISCLNKGNK